jgi:hypothetical protein
MQNGKLLAALNKLKPVSLNAIGSLRLMNRVEIKYVFCSGKLADLLDLLASQYQVLEIDDMKVFPYTTTYFDTEDFLFYRQHVRGELERHKIRFRKYEITGTSFLEIKKKTNKGRTIKQRIENELFSDSFNQEAVDFIEEYSPIRPSSLKPVLVNRFTRITLAGFEKKERITIDFNITFSDAGGGAEVSLPYLAIAEIKKEAYADSSMLKGIIKKLKVYPTGFSKYCVGSALTNPSLRRNMIKPRILLLNKIENEYT